MSRHRVIRRSPVLDLAAQLLPTEAEILGQDYIDWRDGFFAEQAALQNMLCEATGGTAEEIEAAMAQDNAAACEASLAEIQRQREIDKRKRQAAHWIRTARGQ